MAYYIRRHSLPLKDSLVYLLSLVTLVFSLSVFTLIVQLNSLTIIYSKGELCT